MFGTSARAPEFDRVDPNESSDQEFLSDEAPAETSTVPHRRKLTLGIGAFALVACGVVASVGTSSSTRHLRQPGEVTITMRQLLDHPDVHEVATENIMRVGNNMFGETGNAQEVRRVVEETFRNASRRLSEVSPAEMQALDKVPITHAQKDEVLHMMRSVADPRVQSVGLLVAHAVRDSTSDDPEVMKRHIAHKLADKMPEIRMLHDEVFPKASSLRQLVAYGGAFEHLLAPESVRHMKSTGDGWDAHFKMSAPELIKDGPGDDDAEDAVDSVSERRLDWFTKPQHSISSPYQGQAASSYGTYSTKTAAYNGQTTTNRPLGMSMAIIGLIGAALSESTVLLRIMKPLAKMFNNDINVPPMVTSGLGAANAVFESGACELNAANDQMNPIEILMCPFEFGSEGFDALREFFTLIGLLGDNNPANGRQGNHNGRDNEHWGILDDN